MMKKRIVLILLVLLTIICTLLSFSCEGPSYDSKDTDFVSSSVTKDEYLYWIEYQGRFYTQDISKAQAIIPFDILLPKYFPNEGQGLSLPLIDGPLKESQNFDDEITVNIKYAINIGNYLSTIIIFTESNSNYDIGDPETDPNLEEIIIRGKSVIKTIDEWSPDTDTYYCFNSKGINCVIEMHNLPDEESYKIVESMILQDD